MRIPEKILIIRFSSLGDIVLASPLLRALRNTFPRAQIDFLVKSEYADLVRYSPHVSSVIELRSSDKEELHQLKDRIRAERYDTILDIHNSLRSRYLRMFAHARRVYAVDKRVVSRFALVNLKQNFYKEVISVAERYLEAAFPLGILRDDAGLEIFIPDEITSTVNAMMTKYKLERYGVVIGVVPTARHFTKRWPPERFREFGIRMSKEQRAKLFLFGSAEEVDYCGDIAQMINAEAASSAAESLAGRISMLETAAVLDHCSIVVTNDSGIMHLAASRRKKVVAIFGSTVKEFGFFPYKTPHIVIERQGLPCRPCSHIGQNQCPEGHFRCMKDITVEDVVSAVQTMLIEQNGS